ncbi:trypsin-like peptidase domain-containing protein [Merismopedia glauca]|uniref:Serine/threonine protein kinase n=1 Tax=Merismopedia glauca CCAP 1448/3 TaxID=1296344 RepID=A0A2T1C2E8_9CYAN|nr:trypsin-like peptidase domain-containing protein [Merismopedia glauca]PSB02422.1 serine/threonine protein kinase [Merismopedia glauca CCAP 1448/3]
MIFHSQLATLMATVIVVGLVQVGLALSPPEVSDLAKRITVRIDGGAPGTGVIVSQQGNTYTVLTNAHVLPKRKSYMVRTFDGRIYQVSARQIKRLLGVDLSILEFSSQESYAIAEIGNSDQLTEGILLYIGGWAATDRVNRERGYRFSEGRLSGRATNPEEGYALIYSNVVKPGMSGSPILNDEGQLVGINGKAVPDLRTGEVDYYGIPINIYLQLAKKPIPSSETASSSFKTPSVAAQIEPFSRSWQISQPTQINPLPRSITVTTVPNVEPTSDSYSPSRNADSSVPTQPKFSLVATLTGHAQSIYGLAYSPDGKTLASGSADRTIKIWDMATGKDLYTLNGHGGSVYSVAYNPRSQSLASASADKTIKIWDLITGKEIRTLTGHMYSVKSIAYSPDGQNLASGSWDKTIKVWDVATGQQIYTLTGHTNAIDSIAYSPDGKTLASGSADKTIKLWDLTTGREIKTLAGHTQAINALAYSPDGKILASGSGDKTIKIWDVATGQEIRTLTGHSETVDALAYSLDGQTLASGSGDKTIKIWDVATGQEIRTLTGSNDSVYALAYSPDGQTLASGSSNMNLVGDRLEFASGSITIWQLSGR